MTTPMPTPTPVTAPRTTRLPSLRPPSLWPSRPRQRLLWPRHSLIQPQSTSTMRRRRTTNTQSTLRMRITSMRKPRLRKHLMRALWLRTHPPAAATRPAKGLSAPGATCRPVWTSAPDSLGQTSLAPVSFPVAGGAPDSANTEETQQKLFITCIIHGCRFVVSYRHKLLDLLIPESPVRNPHRTSTTPGCGGRRRGAI